MAEIWTSGRAPEIETILDRKASFKGTPFKRGDKVKVVGKMQRATTHAYSYSRNGPKIYDYVVMTADYIITCPEGNKYISTKISGEYEDFRFPISWVEPILDISHD